MYNFPFAVQGVPTDGQIIAFDTATGQAKWIDPPDPDPVPTVYGTIVQNNGPDNTFEVGDDNTEMQPVTGDEFNLALNTEPWTLTAEGCVLGYGGTAATRWLVTLMIALQSDGGDPGNLIGNIAIAHNQDLVGLANPAYQVSVMRFGTIDNVQMVTTQRIVILQPGDELQPVCQVGTDAATVAISTLLMAVTPLPSGDL